MQNEKILKELYHGNITPVVKAVVKGSEFHKLQCQLYDVVEKLTNLLNEKEQELLEQAIDTWGNLNLICGEERFTEGFRLGARIMLEILKKTTDSLNLLQINCPSSLYQSKKEFSQ